MRIRIDPKNPPRGRTDWKRLAARSEAEIEAAARSDPDARPLTNKQLSEMRRPPNVSAIRRGMAMTQAQLARAFHLSIATVRDWEQGRFQPDRAARTLLYLIQKIPNEIRSALGRRPGVGA